jgi:hypothetical protein
MPRSIEIQFGQITLQLCLSALIIRLHTYDTSPSHINPDFLRFNNVAPSDWAVTRPVSAQSDLYRVNYSNGISVLGTEDRISFRQTNLDDLQTELLVPGLVSRYLESPMSGITFDAVSIEPTCVIEYPPGAEPPVQPRAWYSFEIAVPIDETRPQLLIRSVYRFPDSNVAITVSEQTARNDEASTELNVSGQMHFPISDDQDDVIVAREHIDRWQQALRQFYLVATEVCLRQISIGEIT